MKTARMIIAIAFALSLGLARADLSDGLVAHYPLDNSTSDTTENNNDGVIIGGVSPTEDRFGNAIFAYDFNGVDGYIEVPSSASLNFAGDFSVSMWVLVDSYLYSSVPISKGLGDGGPFYFSFSGNTNKFVGRLRTENGYAYLDTNVTRPLDGQWHHYAMTFTSGVQKIFYDGVLKNTTSVTGTLVSNNYPMQIGHMNGRTYLFDGKIDEVRLYSRELASAEVLALFNSEDPALNDPPVADAGEDQAIRAGDTVFLNGSASFDDNSPTSALLYSWVFSALPAGSDATIIGENTATPSFVADLADTYAVELIVTDEGGLSSASDEVLVSAENLAPTAIAGNDKLVIIGTTVNLDGSASSDPEFDSLTYAWTISAVPSGSSSMLAGANTVAASFVADLEGTYQLNLMVSDIIGPGAPDEVQITAATAEDFSEAQIVSSGDIVAALVPGQVTTGGNQNALLNFLSQAVTAIQEGDLVKAIDKLEKALIRTDGCVLRGLPDGNGAGRDWITDCTAQIEVYGLLSSALAALAP